MKLKSILFLTTCLLMVACNDSKSYKIEGTTTGIEDGSTVYLRAISDSMQMIDSAIVNNGMFEISHSYDSVSENYSLQVLFINRENDRMWTAVEVYAEPRATIKVHLDLDNHDNNSVEGSPLNDKSFALTKELRGVESQMDSVRKMLEDNSLTDDQKAMGAKAYDSLFNIRVKMKEDFALKNTDNLIGVSLLSVGTALFSNEVKKQLLEKISEKYQSHPAVVAERERIEIEEKTAEGKPFTDFEMADPEGKIVKLSDFTTQNKLTLVDFWASWCGPCRQEIPNIKKLYASFKGRGLGLVGVSLDQKKENWVNAIKTMQLDYPQMSDIKGWDCAAVPLYNIQGIPFTLLVAQDGTIVGRNLHGEELANKIESFLK